MAINYKPLNKKRIHESILTYITHTYTRKLFLTMECHLMNMGGIIESENHHLVTMIVITNSPKKPQRMLKLVGESLMRNGIFT